MSEHPDVILYLLFESIRGDWSNGIDIRGQAIVDILPHTTFLKKNEMTSRMLHMVSAWNEEGDWFDGRHWARDGEFCYYELFKHFATLENLNNTKLLKWGKSDGGTDRMECDWKIFSGCHDDTMKLYNVWRRELNGI